jgi:hypothetical protein
MNSNRLLEELRNLEVELHRPDVRSNVERLDTLLHESLVEFGRSGRSYNKADIIEQLPEEKSKGSIWSQDYSLEEIADGVALLMYRSAHLHENGELTRHTNRSSLWQRTAFGWQMRFHQGTPIEEFLINDPYKALQSDKMLATRALCC